jgi:HEAT repeat protein
LQALGNFNDAALLPIFQEEFRKDQEPLWALHVAAKLPDSGGESLLIEGLQHAYGGVRRWAADLLEPVATDGSIEALRCASKDIDSGVRCSAIATLSRLDGARQVDIFLDALEDEDSSVRGKAREALGKAGGQAVVARLVEIVRTPDRMYREDAARLLGEVGDESAIPTLCEALRDADTGEAAALSLGKLVKPGMPAVTTLEKLALDSNSGMREAARRALCEIADPTTIGTLNQMLDDEDAYAHNRAEAALQRIRKPEAQRALAEWRRKSKKR